MRMRDLRRAAWEREQGRCAATGVPLGDPDAGAWDLHHRRPKGMGGTVRPDTDTLANLVALLAPAHNMGAQWLPVDGVRGRSVHTDPEWSRPLGLLVSKGEPEAMAVPIRHALHGWVYLLPDGSVQPI